METTWIIVLLAILIVLSVIGLLKKESENTTDNKESVIELEKLLAVKEQEISSLRNEFNILKTKLESFEQLKTEKTKFEERLNVVED